MISSASMNEPPRQRKSRLLLAPGASSLTSLLPRFDSLRDYGPDAQDLIWHLVLQRYKQKYYPQLLEDADLEQETITVEPTPKPDDPEFALIHPEKEIIMEEKATEQEEEEEEDEPMEVELPEWLR